MFLRFSTPGVSNQGDDGLWQLIAKPACTEEEMMILLTTIEFGDARTKQEQQPAQNRPPGQIFALRRS
jgi:hypothetical protein